MLHWSWSRLRRSYIVSAKFTLKRVARTRPSKQALMGNETERFIAEMTDSGAPKIVDPDPPERPATFEPFERWKAVWKPPENYIDLREVKKVCDDHGFQIVDVLTRCQCLGFTMHKEVEIPPSTWTDAHWVWDVDDNRCGQPHFGEHLQFQVAVFRDDVLAAIQPEQEREEEHKGDVRIVQAVGVVESQAVLEGWELHTIGGVVFQAVGRINQDPSSKLYYGPMRVSEALAVADAWSYFYTGEWR